MDRRITLVTLGVRSVPEARAFYERLGWRASGASQGDDVAFFQLNGLALSLFGRKALADDARVADAAPGFSGISLAQNLRSPAAVDAAFAQAVAAGATCVETTRAYLLGRLRGLFRRPRRPSLGTRPQPLLSAR